MSKLVWWLPAIAAVLVLAGFDIAAAYEQRCGTERATVVGTNEIDLLVGTSGDDVIWAGAGADVIYGGGGDDLLCGADGDDWISGGNGDDTILGGPGFDKILGQAGNDVLFGQGEDDSIDGGTGTDTINGDSGNDRLFGGIGPDVLDGGPGHDALFGHSGDDRLFGSDATDTLRGGTGDDHLDGGAGRDELFGEMGNDELVGGDAVDVLFGGPGEDILLGGEGRDELHGDTGSDVLVGGGRTDQLFGGQGDDYLRLGQVCEGEKGNDVVEDCVEASDGKASDAPQIVLLAMLDDADYHDFGFNSVDALTPNIDRVATSGVQLSDYYAASGICSPTRLSVMTGDNPSEHGLTRLWPDIHSVPVTSQTSSGRKGLDDDRLLLTDLSMAGYSTAHFGKWHLGDSRVQHGPGALGFDEYRIVGVDPSDETGGQMKTHEIANDDWNNRNFSWAVTTESGERIEPGAWRPEYLADEIIAYLDSLEPGERAFINWWAIAPHKPIRTPPGFDNSTTGFDLSTERGQLLAMMHDWDAQLGRVLDHLDASGLTDDSLVMVTSDNGGVRTALSPERELTGAKATLSEGGIRVPFVASWPAAIAPGTTSAEPMVSADLLPTLFGRVGLPVAEGYGVDAFNALLGESVDRPSGLSWNMRTGVSRIDDASLADQDEWAYRDGCFKLLKRSGESAPELYNLCDDPSESVDLAVLEPEIYADLVAIARSERVRQSAIEVVPASANVNTLVPFDERFNIFNQDFSLSFDLAFVQSAQQATLFETNGLQMTFDPDRETLTVSVTGTPSDRATTTKRLVTKRISAEVPNNSTVTVLVGGFANDYSTIELLVDGEVVSTLSGRNSVFTLQSGREALHIGSRGYTMTNIAAATLVIVD